jgi:hypothetical protein
MHTEIEDPLKRLHAVIEDANQTKATTEALGKTLLVDLVNVLIPLGADLLVSETILPAVNCTASNVRGPDIPLYLAGARMARFYPLNIVFNGLGLTNTAFSYNGTFSIGAVSCSHIMPDLDFYMQCLRESFEELSVALDVAGQSQSPVPAAKKARGRTGTGSKQQKPGKH